MRIGVLTTSFPRHSDDVAGHFVLGMCSALARRGHHMEVLAPEPPAGHPDRHFGAVRVQHVPYLRPQRWQRTFYGAGVPDNLRLDPRAWLGAAPFTLALWHESRTRSREWDAVISHWAVPCALVAGLLPHRPRHVAVLHSADVHALTRLPGGSVLATQVARTADALWFVSADLRDRFLSRLPAQSRGHALAKSHVCPMGIDPMPTEPIPCRPLRTRARVRETCSSPCACTEMVFSSESGRDSPNASTPSRAESRTRTSTNTCTSHEHAAVRRIARVRTGRPPNLVLLALGRLVPVKGLDVAIEAVAGMPDVQLVIAGDGPERARLSRKAAATDNVRLIGPVFGAEKRAWLEASDALLLPSRRLASGRTEGAPTVLLEAMDAGLPVIASDVGGVREVLGAVPHSRTESSWRFGALGRHVQGGYLVPPGNPAALAAAIDQLRSLATRTRMGHRGRERARQFHWNAIAPHAEALLRSDDVAVGRAER